MSEPDRIIHVVDDDEAIRRSVGFMLRTSGYVVRTWASGLDLLAQDEIALGCILIDVRMPAIGGLELQLRLRARDILHPVVVMTGHGDTHVAVQAMKNGAVDFIEKPFDKETLLLAVEEAFARLDSDGRRNARAEQARARLNVLSARERDVLEGLVRGHPNKTIGYDLGISPRTVEIHRAHLMTKLGVTSLSETLRIAFVAGMGDEESA